MPTAVDTTMKVMYVKGPAADADQTTILQLSAAAPELDITTAQGAAEALAEIRKSPTWRALLVSAGLPPNETLALIATLRRDRVPMAIVPVVDEAQRDLFAAAIASGADDVLLRRGQGLVNVSETLARMRQSPHLFPVDERRRIGVIYAGRDALVWNLLEQVPFVRAQKIAIGVDGVCPVRPAGSDDNGPRTDAVVIDEQPGEAHPLQVLKSVKAQASDLPVIMLTSTGTTDVATAALELGADDTVLKSGIFRRRLIATLRRVHQRLELTMQQAEMKIREERLRQIVEHVPTGIAVVSADGAILAMNGAALQLFGGTKPRDVVGADIRKLVVPSDHERVSAFIRRVTGGQPDSTDFAGRTLDGGTIALSIRGVILERDARGTKGIIASISRPGAHLALGTNADEHAHLASVDDEVRRLEQHQAELEGARAREQAAWEAERVQLEARAEAAERNAAERADLARRLEDVTVELDRANSQFGAERQALEAQMRQLEDAARNAATADSTTLDLESTLESVREELRQAIAAHTIERGGWQSIREELESRVAGLDAVKTQAIGSANPAELGARLQELTALLDRERTTWEEARQRLESDLRSAREALWAEYAERDKLRGSLDTELSNLRALLATERTEWEGERAGLEREKAELKSSLGAARQINLDGGDRLRTLVDDRARDLAKERQRHAEAEANLRAELDRVSRELEAAHARAAEIADEFTHARETDRRSAVETEAALRAAVDDARQELAASVGRLQSLTDEHARAGEASVHQQHETEVALRAALDDARAEAEAAKARVQSLTDEHERTSAEARAEYERSLAELRSAADTARAELTTTEDRLRALADAQAHTEGEVVAREREAVATLQTALDDTRRELAVAQERLRKLGDERSEAEAAALQRHEAIETALRLEADEAQAQYEAASGRLQGTRS